MSKIKLVIYCLPPSTIEQETTFSLSKCTPTISASNLSSTSHSKPVCILNSNVSALSLAAVNQRPFLCPVTSPLTWSIHEYENNLFMYGQRSLQDIQGNPPPGVCLIEDVNWCHTSVSFLAMVKNLLMIPGSFYSFQYSICYCMCVEG